jgi:putative transposase
MSGRPKADLLIGSDDDAKLRRMAHPDFLRPAIALRARIVLACANGETNAGIAKRLALSKTTVGKWRRRFIESGCAGLFDKKRSGKPLAHDRKKIADLIDKARNDPASGVPGRRSIRFLAEEFGLSKSSVHRYLRQYGARLPAAVNGLFADEPFFFQRLRNIGGLYLNPPDNALILGIEKLADYLLAGRAQKAPASGDGCFGEMQMLAGALNAASGVARRKFAIRQRHRELSEFLEHIENALVGDLEIHLVVSNASMCAHPKIRSWIKSHSRWRVHIAPPPNLWLPLAEQIFQAPGIRGNYRERAVSASNISREIALFVADFDRKTRPFLWMRPAAGVFQ